jgi:Domain of unknown function (DUF6754)
LTGTRWPITFLIIAILAATFVCALAQEATEEPVEEIAPVIEVAQEPVLPAIDLISRFTAADNPNDGGRAILIKWEKPKAEDLFSAQTLVISRKGPDEAEFVEIGQGAATNGRYVDSFAPAGKGRKGHALADKTTYQYRVSLKEYPAISSEILEAVSKGQWFNIERTSILLATLLYVAFVVFLVRKARSGEKMYVRPISGIAAVEEAVGRATEMGKPVLYIPGIGEIQEVATLAALTILSPIAEKVAEYSTPIMVPNRDPVVFSVAQEIVREAYIKAGHPDEYNEDAVFFLSGRQFAYAAAVSGIMMREKPATNFFFGMFYAESLILAETGAATGAIQIAGTDQVAQLPFFIATCDYTLIGEELYAASAYLSDDPVLVGSLKALDWAKIVIMTTIAVGLGMRIFGLNWLAGVI